MKKLLFQKFIKDNFKIFSAIILSIGSIVWILQSVSFLDFVTEDGHSFKVYFYYTALNFPKIIHRILPFAFFISLFYQIVHYEKNNQLLVFWIHGVKKIQLINLIIVYAILLAFFQIILGGYISPKGQDGARSFIRSSNLDFFPSIVRPGKFVDAVEGLTIFIEKENENGMYENIFLKDDLGSENKSQLIFANRAELLNFQEKRYFKLYDGRLVKIHNKKIDTFEFETIDFDLSKFATKTTVFPKIQEVNTKILMKCLIYNYKNELQKFTAIKFLRCNKTQINNVQQEILKRFYLPFYIPLIALIASLLILRSKENKEYNFTKFLLFAVIFFVIVTSELSLRYSSQGIVGLIFFTLLPILTFVSIYLILIKNLKHKI